MTSDHGLPGNPTTEDAPGRRGPAVLAVVAFACLVCLWAYRTESVVAPAGVIEDPALWGMEDFRDGVYYPIRAMLDGANPYYTSRYRALYPVGEVFPLFSPAVLLVHLPFGLLPPGPAHVAFFVWSVFLVLVLSRLLHQVADRRATVARVFGIGAVILAGRPLYMMLTLGQWTLIVIIGVVLALHHARSRPTIGGVGLALAALKPTFGVPLAIFMLARRERRAVLVGLLISAAAAAVPLAVLVAAGGPVEFIAGLQDNVGAYWGESVNRLDTASWGRVDAAVAMTRLLPLPPVGWLSAAVSLLIIGLVSIRLLRLPTGGAASRSSLIVSVAILVGIYHQAYDAALLALPLFGLAFTAQPPLARGHRIAATVLLTAVWFNYVATYTGLARLALEPWSWPWRVVTSFNAFALLLVLALAAARSAERQDIDPAG